MALTAPFIGLLAESVGRKKVIVPSLYALTVPTLLAATSQNLHQLIFWRFMQGVFVPGVIVVIMAYINEEFPRQPTSAAPWRPTFREPCWADFWGATSPGWSRTILPGEMRSSSSGW